MSARAMTYYASGFDSLGAFWDVAGDVLKAGAAVAEGQIEQHQAGEVEAKTASEEHARFEAAKAADAQAATAIAHAIVSGATDASTAPSDRSFAKKMFDDAMEAHGRLAPDSEKMRDAFARAQLGLNRARSAASPADGYKKALADAWQKIVRSNAPFAEASASASRATSGEPWLTRRVWGPIPGYGVLVGGGGILAGVGYALKKLFWR